ncbi:MAG: hypothetical protein CMD68_02670 [Gammaproteobacteria bacterium]|nr:hypothetical protein [Gammaproteobacteria bacterium]|tara:strand:- start:4778 stop:5884 length:1107 start_codon:yes stop_codon:yes gene_type:complete
MDERYFIHDDRTFESFKKKTFSGFKKNDIINAVLKSIESKKVENACHWTTECVLSGYSHSLWEKLINFSTKIIHINNPKLPSYLFKKNKVFMNQVRRLDSKSKDRYIFLRNSQMIRNLFFDVVSTLATSSKTKRYDKYPKINDKEDFNFTNIQKRLCAQMNILPSHIIHFNDPDELRIIMNEIFTLLKNKQFGYDKCCYWILWLMRYETIHKKKKTPWIIDEREIEGIPKKYRGNIVWVLWEVILEEMKSRTNKMIKIQINSLYELYKYNYTVGKRGGRVSILFNAIGYLTHQISFKLPVRSDYKLFIQVQSNVNKMFGSKKKDEIRNITDIQKKVVFQKPPKKQTIDIEIIQDKIGIFNEIDKMIMN